jgi:ribosomal protein S12 methylthiotransferase accessory factor
MSGEGTEQSSGTGTEKGFTRGTHRLWAPERTVERVLAHRSVYGITRIADITGLDHVGIPVVSVYRPNARALVTAQGKGVTLAAAKASGLMEAVESYHAERIRLPLKHGSYRELATDHSLVDPMLLPRTRSSRYGPDMSLLLIRAWDLMAGEGADRIWVPYECVHTNFSLPLPPGSGAFMMTSNGLASGNHVLEAISHGICEVVERHANAMWQIEAGDPASERRRLR